MHHKPQVTGSDTYDGMSPTVGLNTDIIWLVLQHAAYTGNVWDHHTLNECCRVSREWYPLAKRMLFRFVVLRNRGQLRALQQARGKHLQIGPSAPPGGLGYDAPVPADTWEAQTRILKCFWCNNFRFNDILHALALFPSLYEVRVVVHIHEHLQGDGDDSSLAIPSTIRALRCYATRHLPGRQNIAAVSHIISVLSKHCRLRCLQFKGVSILPHLQLPLLLQSFQVNALLYLELEISHLPETLSGDLFPNLLYLVLHQMSSFNHWAIVKRGVFKRVKSLTALNYSGTLSSKPVLRLSQSFPELIELRLGIRLLRLQFATIDPLLSQIPSGLVSFSLLISSEMYLGTEETWPRDSFTIPTSLKYFEYGLRHYPSLRNIVDPPVFRPFLHYCRSKGVQLIPSPIYEMTQIVSVLPNSFLNILIAHLPAGYGNDPVRTLCECAVFLELSADESLCYLIWSTQDPKPRDDHHATTN